MPRMAIGIAGLLVLALAGASVTPLRAQQTGAIRITAPANGATISEPVSVSVDITGVTVKPAAEGDPNAYHYHALVDLDPATVVQAGQPLPTGQANIIHTADRTITIPNLSPGAHTVTVVLTKTDHVPLSPSVQDRVQFTVAGAGQAQTPAGGAGAPTAGQPRVGTGIAARGTALPVIMLPLALAALGAGILLIRRRNA